LGAAEARTLGGGIKSMKPVMALLVASTVVLSCAPHWFEGTGAILTESSEIEIVLRQRDWGNCYRAAGTFPTVYRVSRPKYTLLASHGQRYWPEFFLEAISARGEKLSLAGPMIEPVEFPYGGDMSRLRASRGTSPTHHTGTLANTDERTIEIEVLDGEQHVLGRETLNFRVENVRCLEWDSV
jgi:hypothetical protein